MKTPTTIEALQHTDVRGKILKYIRLKNGEHEVLINVGDKTYQSVKELEKAQQIPLHDEDKKNKK